MSDIRDAPNVCPFCGQELESAGLVGQNSKKERAAVFCANHGDIEIEWSKCGAKIDD